MAQAAEIVSPRTEALKRALAGTRDEVSAIDLLFLETWEVAPAPGAAAALRVHQLRRANPLLAAEIRAELDRGRPLTNVEREALQAGAAGH
jgi:hypothetical protein